MSKELQILKQKVKNMEAKLRQPVLIKSIQDFINLVQRYRRYIEAYNDLGNRVAKQLLKSDYIYLKRNRLCYRLYLDTSADKLHFINDSGLTDYIDVNNCHTITELIDLYNNDHYNFLKTDFNTPVMITDNIKSQLPSRLFFHQSETCIDDILHGLMKIRTGKLERLMPHI